MKQRVVVGLSGGVDSSVAAALLLERGYDVIGLFMKNWHDTSVTVSAECPWLDDSNDALATAEKLGIPFQVIDLSEQYRQKVVDYMFAEYEKGRTPNPDVLCNREIKFDVFLKAALGLGADYVATGHYCRKEEGTANGKKIYRLLAGTDKNKDQSYFLCQLNQEQLAKALFPIGDLEKPKVREIAARLGLPTAEKPDSQGICFVGKVKLPDFLKQKLAEKSGKIIEIPAESGIYNRNLKGLQGEDYLKAISAKPVYSPEMGTVAGEHNGAHFFTTGQRKGLNVGGKAEPVFVIDMDTGTNIVYAGQGKQHPGLYRRGLFISNGDVHWLRPDLALKEGESMRAEVRIRYRQPLQWARLVKTSDGLFIEFDISQSAITAGQFAAWYIGEELVGSGAIA